MQSLTLAASNTKVSYSVNDLVPVIAPLNRYVAHSRYQVPGTYDSSIVVPASGISACFLFVFVPLVCVDSARRRSGLEPTAAEAAAFHLPVGHTAVLPSFRAIPA